MSEDDRERALDELVILWVTDRDGGVARTDGDYLALFPGHEEEIREELGRLRKGAAGVAPPSDDELRPEARPRAPAWDLGRYRIERELGRGGGGTVFLARDTVLDRAVAVKVLKAAWSGSSVAIRRFEREARALASLSHPGLATIHDSGALHGLRWFAMPLVEGRTLREDVARRAERREPLDDAELTRLVVIVEKAARSLHAAHEQGFVHRDVKPGNLMIRSDDEPVVLDFGLATFAESADQGLTMTGDVLGTPGFMAPEQSAAEHARVDRRTDVWALGATLRWAASLGGAAPRRLPRRIEAVLAAAMDPDPDRRYATAAALADDLAHARLGLPLAIRPPGRVSRLLAWCRRSPAAAALVILAPLALIAGIVALERKNATIRDAEAATRRQETAAIEATRRAAARFADYQRLDDLRRVDDLVAREAALGPPRPDAVPALERWLSDATVLLDRLPEHRAALAALRTHGRAVVLREPGIDPAMDEMLAYERVRDAARLELREPTAGEARRAHLGRIVEEASRRIAGLEPTLESRPSWRYDRVEDEWLDENLHALVTKVAALGAPSPYGATRAAIERRLETARNLERITLVEPAAAWREAIAAIANPATDPAYRGLRIEPVLGLVPLGRDPKSRLWEFSHVTSGVTPARNAAGVLEVTADSAIVLVLVPGGKARTGARPPTDDEAETSRDHVDPDAQPHEGPVHDVDLDPFFIAKHEMTQGQWLRATGSNPSFAAPGRAFEHGYRPDLRHPVEQVSFEDCAAVLARLDLVLPTEVQWEWAARAGTTTPWWTGETIASFLTAENLADSVWMRAEQSSYAHDPERNDGWAGTAPVGSYPPNPFGLHDVVGNVAEWCRDPAAIYEAHARPGDGLRTGGRDDARMVRGGSCAAPAARARSSYRFGMHVATRAGIIGVRPAMPLVPP
jgi:formylglycine-generating enzyme required for sulfatase activity